MTDQNKIKSTPTSRIFVYSPIEKKASIDQTLESCFDRLQGFKSTDSTGRQLSQYVLQGRHEHDEISAAYLYAILIDPSNASDHFKDMVLQNSDQLETVSLLCSELIINGFRKLTEQCQNQLWWLMDQAIKAGVRRLSGLIVQLLREIQHANDCVLNSAVSTLKSNLEWILNTTLMASTVVYCLLPLIRSSEVQSDLRQNTIDLIVSLIRLKWPECARIGRDFIRCLQSVCTIPEFYLLWQDILKKKLSGMDESHQLESILMQKTQRKFLCARLTYDMERKISFLLNEVKLTKEIEYYKQWLDASLTISNKIDLVRYLCSPACILETTNHKSNNKQHDEIKYHILCWLVASADNPLDVSNIRLAFVYDWLAYQQNQKYCIDPSITKCFNWSIKFMEEMSIVFIPHLKEMFKCCVQQFVSNVYNCVNGEIRETEEAEQELPVAVNVEQCEQFSSSDEDQNNEEEEENSHQEASKLYIGPPNPSKKELKCSLNLLSNVHRTRFHQIIGCRDLKKRKQLINEWIQGISRDCRFVSKMNKDDLANLAFLILYVIRFSIDKPLISNIPPLWPMISTKPNFEMFSQSPLFIFFTNLSSEMLALMEQMCNIQRRLSYLYLTFLCLNNSTVELYNIKNIQSDLWICFKDDPSVFYYILPYISSQKLLKTNNVNVIRLLTSSANPKQVSEICCALSSKIINLFNVSEPSFLMLIDVIQKEWTNYEQDILWTFINAQCDLSSVCDYFYRLDDNGARSISQRMAAEGPRKEYMRALLSRHEPDTYTSLVLIKWCEYHIIQTTKCLLNLIPNNGEKSPKRRRNSVSSDDSSSMQLNNEDPYRILKHLDYLRLTATDNSNCLRLLTDSLVCHSIVEMIEEWHRRTSDNCFDDLLNFSNVFVSGDERPRRAKAETTNKHLKKVRSQQKKRKDDAFGWKPCIRLNPDENDDECVV